MAAENVGQVSMDLILNSKEFKTQLSEAVNQAIKGSSRSANNAVSGMFSKLGKVAANAFAFYHIAEFTKSSLELGSAAQQVKNVVAASYGEMSDDVINFSKTTLKNVGIMETHAQRYMGIFGAMSKSFGFTTEQAFGMSKTLTEMIGDIASFYDLDHDVVFTKLKSVFTGETESLKELGVVMTENALNQFAMEKGLSKTVQKMTEQEKVALRYAFVQEKLKITTGDFIRTQDDWANQTRILNLQWQQFKATLGQGFINVLTPLIKHLNILMEQLILFAEVFRRFTVKVFGDATTTTGAKVFGDAMGDLAANTGAVGDAAVGTAKKIKKSIMGFDQLNVLKDNSDSGAGGASIMDELGGLLNTDISIPAFKEMTDAEYDKIAKKLKNILGYTIAIGATIAGWKIGRWISEWKILETIFGSLGTKLKFAAGAALALGGAALEAKGLISGWTDGFDLNSFIDTLAGGGSLVAGAAIIGKTFGSTVLGASIGAIIAGIPAYIVGVKDAIMNGLNWLNGILIPAGSAAAGAGIGAIIGSLGGPIGAGVGALIGLLVGLVTDLVILIVQEWEAISKWFKDLWEVIKTGAAGAWSGLKNIFSGVGDWFSEKVVTPVANFFSNLWDVIALTANNCWEAIKEFFRPAVEWFKQLWQSIAQTVSDIVHNIAVIVKGCWMIIQAVWSIVAEWFKKNVVEPVSLFFTNLWNTVKDKAINAWNGIKNVFATISGWINTYIVIPVSTFFTNMWNGFKNKAKEAWDGVKQVFGNVADFFGKIFSDAWARVIKVFSIGGEIFVKIKDGIVAAFKKVVNGIIYGLNEVISIPFNRINGVLEMLKNFTILGMQPFKDLRAISVPQIPMLANGGYVAANTPQLAVVGDNKREGEIIAPESKITEAVAQAMTPIVVAIQQLVAKVGTNENTGDITIPIILDGNILDTVVVSAGTRKALRTGGR